MIIVVTTGEAVITDCGEILSRCHCFQTEQTEQRGWNLKYGLMKTRTDQGLKWQIYERSRNYGVNLSHREAAVTKTESGLKFQHQ